MSTSKSDQAAEALAAATVAATSALIGSPGFAVGVDVEELGRWSARRIQPDRLFASVELGHAGMVPADRARRLAGTWCAKEAVVKAASVVRLLSLREVVIERDASGRPVVRVEADPTLAGQLSVSISHTDAHVVAVAVLALPSLRSSEPI